MLLNAYVLREYSVVTFLQTILSTFIFFLWVIFSHMFWALPHLLSSPKKYLKYSIRLLAILIVAIGISAVSTYWLKEVRTEFSNILYEDPVKYAHWVTFESAMLIIVSTLVKFSLDFFRLQARQNEIENQKLSQANYEKELALQRLSELEAKVERMQKYQVKK